jgi:aryl-alcohol dehydrogenase-like predicted oxidoreductase
MQYRPLGASGIEVSTIGLGLAALGRPGYINLGHGDDLSGRTDPGALENHAHEMLDAARAAGISYIDVARSYGRGEEFLSAWLAASQPAREEIAVGSKWGYVYTADWQTDAEVHEVKIHTRPNLDRQWDESRGLLGSHLRLYQIHSATIESGVLENTEVLGRLGELSDAGVVIGFTTSGPDQASTIRTGLEVEVRGRPLFGAVQATWNLLEPSAGGALSEAAEAGLGVIVKESVANGRLTPRNEPIVRRLESSAPGWAPDAIAIAAAMHQPWASTVLSGAATHDHLAGNLRAVDVPPDVTGSLPDMAETPAEYWATRSSLSWG